MPWTWVQILQNRKDESTKKLNSDTIFVLTLASRNEARSCLLIIIICNKVQNWTYFYLNFVNVSDNLSSLFLPSKRHGQI